MSDLLTDAHHDWVTALVGVDPRDWIAPPHAATPPVPSEQGSGAGAAAPIPSQSSAGTTEAQPPPATSAKDDPVWQQGFQAGLDNALTTVPAPMPLSEEATAVFLDGVAAGQAEAARRSAAQTPAADPPPSDPPPAGNASPPADENRFVTAIKIAANKLGGAVGGKLMELVSPANLALMTAFMAAYIAAQSTPAGWVADGVAAVGLLASAVFIGKELFTVIDDVRAFVSICNSPSGDLDSAGDHLAHAVATIGVDTLLILLTHKAGSAAKPYLKPPEGFVDVVTPDGEIVRIPQEVASDPAMQTKGSGEGGGKAGASDPVATAKLQARDALASEKGKLTAKGRSEADSVLQGINEGKVRAAGEPRRINPDAREPDHDFAMEKDGKVTGYVEIKTPVDPKLRPLATQAAEIAGKIIELKPDGGLQILVDLKNLAASDKAAFLQALKDNGLDPGSITILNN